MGPRYVGYRVFHEIEKKTGRLIQKHPVNQRGAFFLSVKDWKKNSAQFVIRSKENITFPKSKSLELKNEVGRILGGEIKFFNSDWKNIGIDFDWITNPETGFRYDISKHWSQVPDMSPEAGDIKYVWEKSRFSYIITIIRNDYHNNEDHSEFVFAEIESWIDKNPVNQGPNWRCSQEISLRIFNWCYAVYFYQNSKAFNEKRWNKIQNVIYWSLHHVYLHINFSRIAVRNNHAITETLLLSLSNILFPFIPETEKWAKKGTRWFEEEIGYQLYSDGTFLQFSMNYHRVVIQLLSFGIAIKGLNRGKFVDLVYDRAYQALDFLYQCLEEKNGYLPNYGSNDGALFFPLSLTDYRDYRPQLNTLHRILTGEYLYNDFLLCEDSYWVSYDLKQNYINKLPLKKHFGIKSYPVGGFYLFRERKTLTFIRCGNHKDRPAHADNLHIDVWFNGDNILRDSGSYKYNTRKEFQNYFTGTISHNTVVVGNYSQMLKGNRFIWYYWSQARLAKFSETETSYVFEGEISAFRFLNSDARHWRRVEKVKDKSLWIVTDKVFGLKGIEKKQIWHHDHFSVLLNAVSDDSLSSMPNSLVSYNSEYYGAKKKGRATFFTFENEVKTKIQF